jgi:hypothetical protein
MPVVTGSRIDDLGTGFRMVLSQGALENTKRFIGLAKPLKIEWE